MKITQEFNVSQPSAVVWAFFNDVPKVAQCLPGAEYLGAREGNKHAGKVSAKIGPFQASFDGEADVVYDEAAKSVHVEGKGIDRKGASRGKMTMDCKLVEQAGATRVIVDADVQLSGTIAQFGRTGLLTEIANTMIADFVRNAEAQMSGANAGANQDAPAEDVVAARPISVFALIAAVFRSWFRALLRRGS